MFEGILEEKKVEKKNVQNDNAQDLCTKAVA